MTPTVERFRRLARSSPWRWDEVAFVVTWTGEHRRPGVRATVRRPEGLRVADLDGRLLFDGVQPVGPVGAWLSEDGRGASGVPARPVPDLDGDGLVRSVRRLWWEPDGAPMWQDYRWVAMLDPAELADGSEGAPGVEVLEVSAVEHAGREAWEALVRPTADYDPRCSCCPLLYSAESVAAEVAAGLPAPDGAAYAGAHRVRLDVATGVCVLTAEVGGPRDGDGHDLRLTAVR